MRKYNCGDNQELISSHWKQRREGFDQELACLCFVAEESEGLVTLYEGLCSAGYADIHVMWDIVHSSTNAQFELLDHICI